MKSVVSYLQKHFVLQMFGDITWAHAVNTKTKLQHALNNPEIMMLEVDVRISSDGEAVLAHPPATDSDLSFAEFLHAMLDSHQGIKLDLKDPEILLPCLTMLRESNLHQPVLLNAGILQGQGGYPPQFSAAGFLASWKKLYPQAILSPDWTAHPYAQENIEEMLAFCAGIEEITFPVNARLLPDSWPQVSQLIQQAGYTLTVWDGQPVDKDLLRWLREHTDPAKVCYDCHDEQNQRLKWW